jgi:hypothetical protein
LALLGAAGCYRYVASEPGALSPGAEVSIDLSSAGTASVRPALGDFVTRIEGNVASSDASGVTLSLTSVLRRGDVSPSTWNGETIRLAAADVSSVRTREFSRSRTTAAAVALGAASVGLVIAIAKATGLLEVSGGAGKPIPPSVVPR